MKKARRKVEGFELMISQGGECYNESSCSYTVQRRVVKPLGHPRDCAGRVRCKGTIQLSMHAYSLWHAISFNCARQGPNLRGNFRGALVFTSCNGMCCTCMFHCRFLSPPPIDCSAKRVPPLLNCCPGGQAFCSKLAPDI